VRSPRVAFHLEWAEQLARTKQLIITQTTHCVRRDIRIAEVNDPHGALTAMGGADALKAKIQYSDGTEA
jgi:hypothetical protein